MVRLWAPLRSLPPCDAAEELETLEVLRVQMSESVRAALLSASVRSGRFVGLGKRLGRTFGRLGRSENGERSPKPTKRAGLACLAAPGFESKDAPETLRVQQSQRK